LSLLPLAVAAQQPQITSFTQDGTLTWSNGIAGGYYAVESALDLNFAWCPLSSETWNQSTSSSVASCRLPLTLFDQIDMPIPGFASLKTHPFFRLVVSSNQIPMPLVTNTLRMVNQSSGPISNIVAGTIADAVYTVVTNIPVLNPSESTDWVDISGPYVFSVWVSGSHYSDGYFLSYDQNGQNRQLDCPLIAFGPPRKETVGVVSKDSITATWIWLNWTSTKQW